jgi:hypothetical protein
MGKIIYSIKGNKMNKLIQLINTDTQGIIIEEIVNETNYSERSYMYHLQIDLYKLDGINSEYKEYELDSDGNKIIIENDTSDISA